MEPINFVIERTAPRAATRFRGSGRRHHTLLSRHDEAKRIADVTVRGLRACARADARSIDERLRTRVACLLAGSNLNGQAAPSRVAPLRRRPRGIPCASLRLFVLLHQLDRHPVQFFLFDHSHLCAPRPIDDFTPDKLHPLQAQVLKLLMDSAAIHAGRYDG
jgi:hypothetical protein